MTSKTISRLSKYRRVLLELAASGPPHVFSHDLAARSAVTAAQVRRDLMTIGFSGSPARGYRIDALLETIGQVLDHPEGLRVALVGVGNLGRAMLSYFLGRRPNLAIVAAFDVDPEKTGRVVHGCRCHDASEIARVCREERVQVALLATPAAAAQAAVDALVMGGVRGIVNFSPRALRAPLGVTIEDMDITATVEKVGYYATRGAAPQEASAA